MDTLPFTSSVIVIVAAPSTTFVPPLSLHNDRSPANHDNRQENCQLLNEYGHGNSGYCPSYLGDGEYAGEPPTPIIRTNVFVRCIDRARQISKRMRMNCRKRSAPDATPSCRLPSLSTPSSFAPSLPVPEASKLTRPIVLRVPYNGHEGNDPNHNGIDNFVQCWDVSSIIDIAPSSIKPGQLATMVSIVSPIASRSGLAFSIAPTRKRVRNGAIKK